ncbi:hypothetical protein Cme02nite_66150 [Catellatospora methionotrophica]|uniref:Uncharacterized protein n=1 Tax=Catellatospora methionotrophica TaxID=121620 RepID=A0A8J3LH80_9ACTN|nr:hypothetical protein [Catellatospora methionotrophica]GIG18283.1 hypothetical protein Cme02nite_66150 [Catellatospora methionotrophica]
MTVATLTPGGRGAAQSVVETNERGVLLATTTPDDLGIGVVVHADDVDVLS